MPTVEDKPGVLGEKIRSLRLSKDIGLRELARTAEVSAALVSQIETDKTTPSIGTLRRIAAALEVPVATFFVGGNSPERVSTDPQTHRRDGRRGAIVRHDQRKHLYLPRSHVKYELLTPNLAGPIEFVWCELEPGHPEGELLSHAGEEVILVLQGELDVYLEDVPHHLEQNDSITFDSAIPHRVANPAETISVHVAAITPPSF